MSDDSWHLIGDIGGTNARFGIVSGTDATHHTIGNYPVAAYPDFDGVLAELRRDIAAAGFDLDRGVDACLAVAGPTNRPTIAFTNSPWHFDRALLSERLGLTTVHIINDFAAAARATPLLDSAELEQVGGGAAVDGAPRVVMGPGTGLGVAGLLANPNGSYTVIAGEGGHVDFAPVTDIEAAVLNRLRARFGRVSIERLCCGNGIVNIYQALADYRQVSSSHDTAAAIGAAAQGAHDPLAGETMALFFAVLGAAAGNFALTFGARGGVYVAGGIVPRYLDLLRCSDFRARFLAKGRFADYLAEIPTYLVLHEQLGLLGAAATLRDVHAGASP